MAARGRGLMAGDEFVSIGTLEVPPDAPRSVQTGFLARLAHFTTRHRWPVIGVWLVLTVVGGVAAGKLSDRWYQSFTIPGKPAYEASKRSLDTLGFGVRPPNVVV